MARVNILCVARQGESSPDKCDAGSLVRHHSHIRCRSRHYDMALRNRQVAWLLRTSVLTCRHISVVVCTLDIIPDVAVSIAVHHPSRRLAAVRYVVQCGSGTPDRHTATQWWDKDETLVVGDMSVDILMGKAAGAAICGVIYGNGSVAELRDVGADYLISDFSELKDLLN